MTTWSIYLAGIFFGIAIFSTLIFYMHVQTRTAALKSEHVSNDTYNKLLNKCIEMAVLASISWCLSFLSMHIN